jgi:hypothetical protein
VGAWTHLWTPPKGVSVPPIPWRRIAIGAALGAIAVGIAAVLLIPPLQEGKRKGAARDAAQQAAIVAAEVKRLTADQRLHRASPGVGGTALRPALEDAVLSDARARVAAGTLDGPLLGATCTPAGRAVSIRPGTRVFKCVAFSSGYKPGKAGVNFASGYPFIATIDYRRHTIAWCKTNPQPGEKAGHAIARVPLSRDCAGTLSKLI